MTMDFTLESEGRHLQVQATDGRAVLLIDGRTVGETRGRLGPRRISAGGVMVGLTFLPRGRVSSVRLLDKGVALEFEPPPGTAAARRYAFSQAHPDLWSARHVVIAVARILFAVLGVSALIGGVIAPLIPHIDLPDLPHIHIPFPHIKLPHIPTPPEPIPAIFDTSGYWIPVIIAIVIARREALKRRARGRPPAAPDR